ncbi:hypothetical protein KA111_00400 [Candidatus Woesebacteria bacterium]|nr:hypothetical protein [Candidatus Woesebacteria bacterium]
MNLRILLIKLVTIITSAALLADSFSSNTKTLSYAGVSSVTLLFIALIYLGFIRLKGNKFLQTKKYQLPISINFIATATLTMVLLIWDFFAPTNYVYAVTRIHQQQLGILSLFLGTLVLFSQSNKWWKKNFHQIILITPFVATLIFIVVRSWPMDYFLQIIKEDRLIENLQVLVLLIGALTLARQLIFYHKKLLKWEMILVVLIASTLTFFAGEEISWGQRIFNIAPNEYLIENNTQNETTVHNLKSIQWSVEVGYAIIGMLGALMWLIKKTKIKLPPAMRWLIPSSYFLGFFFLPGIYYSYPIYSIDNLIREWAEIMELFLYTGIVFHVIEVTLEKTVGKK